MDLRKTILKEHSKANRDKIIRWVGKDQARFDELFHLFLHDEYRVVQRAAWPISYLVIETPSLIKKHFGALIKKMKLPGVHDAVKRNALRLMQDIAIPAKYQGEIMNTCFDYISSPTEKAAIKAFSLTVLEHLSATYPDIKPELKTIIENRWEFETPAFRSRARKILAKL
ncbi:MAG: hypothetical protein NTW29_13425 [Bacteroidetes bacterium]|nr:hypothetical protein [Bacteroidota bacterium]